MNGANTSLVMAMFERNLDCVFGGETIETSLLFSVLNMEIHCTHTNGTPDPTLFVR